jgi:general secretion pathway protein M
MKFMPALPDIKDLPDGKVGQALALAVTALFALALYLLIVSPLLSFYGEQADRVSERTALAERYEALARDLPALRTSDKRWRERAGGELLLEGSSDALAAASLQAAMKGLVEEAGAKLTSAEMLQTTAEGNYRRVGIRVVFSGDLKLVTAVLRQVETSRPLLFVRNFDLHAGGAAASSDDAGEDGDSASAGDGMLAVTLDVYGFRQG